MHGDGHLSEVDLVNKKTGQRRTIPSAGAVQLHRCGAADRLAAGGGRAGRQGLRADGGSPGAVAALVAAAAAVPAGDQPRRRVRGGGRAFRLGQARRLGSRRGIDGSSVRSRVPEGNVTSVRPTDAPSGVVKHDASSHQANEAAGLKTWCLEGTNTSSSHLWHRGAGGFNKTHSLVAPNCELGSDPAECHPILLPHITAHSPLLCERRNATHFLATNH